MKEARKNRGMGALAKAVAASRGNRDLRKHCLTARKSLTGIIETMERARLAVELLARARPFPGPARKKAKNRKRPGQELRVISRPTEPQPSSIAKIQEARAAVPPPTRQEAKEIVGRLICLQRALDFSLTIRQAARYIHTSDLSSFADGVERHVRGLVDLFENYRAANQDCLEMCEHDTRFVTGMELDEAQKQLARIPKIAQGLVDLDIGDHYLPPEFSRGDGQDGSANGDDSP